MGSLKWQKQPVIGVFSKRCSENMQQIYRRTLTPKCDFNKVALQLYWNRISAWVFSCKFAALFQNTFLWQNLWMAASDANKRFRRPGLLLNFWCTFKLHPVSRGYIRMNWFIAFCGKFPETDLQENIFVEQTNFHIN